MLNERLKDRPDIQELYQLMYQNLTADSTLNLEQALLLTLKQKNLAVSEDTLRVLFAYSEDVDWAVRMYQRERVITVLANAGFDSIRMYTGLTTGFHMARLWHIWQMRRST